MYTVALMSPDATNLGLQYGASWWWVILWNTGHGKQWDNVSSGGLHILSFSSFIHFPSTNAIFFKLAPCVLMICVQKQSET